MIDRRRAREAALQSLFQEEFADQSGSNPFKQDREMTPEIEKYATFLVAGVREKLPEIDLAIETHSRNWKVQRMALVDKNILRIAIFEIIHSQENIPPNAAINEAIELAKRYGSNDSRAFVNGILDQIAKTRTP